MMMADRLHLHLIDYPTQCRHLANPNPYTVALAAFILVGILVSYLPQHLKIISRRSSEGLSPWWVLLGGVSSIAAIGNILVLPASRRDIACCHEVSGGECAAALLGVVQIGIQWSCFMFIVMLFLTFFPTTAPPLDSSTASLTQTAPPKKRDAIVVGSTTLLALLLVGIISIALIASHPRLTQSWADTLGTISGVLAATQYLPQIYFTYQMGDVKSLSVATMLIQVPGAFLFAFSLWLRVGWEGWSTWLVYIVTGILQAIVLGMALTYYFRAKAKGAGLEEEEEDSEESEIEEEEEAPGEQTALLGNGHKSRPIQGTQRSSASNANRQLSMLYAATPPEHDSDRSSGKT